MSLLDRLSQLVSALVRPEAGVEDAPERLAAAALLVHVARADGRWSGPERARLVELVHSRFRLPPAAAARLVERADAVDRETDDVAALIDMIGRDLPEAERRRLLAMAYAVAGADGPLHEFEDDLTWRVGRLLGFDDAEILAIRDAALAPANSGAGA
jgi:uncharacterized tellurite resistance protein B-like protein